MQTSEIHALNPGFDAGFRVGDKLVVLEAVHRESLRVIRVSTLGALVGRARAEERERKVDFYIPFLRGVCMNAVKLVCYPEFAPRLLGVELVEITGITSQFIDLKALEASPVKRKETA